MTVKCNKQIKKYKDDQTLYREVVKTATRKQQMCTVVYSVQSTTAQLKSLTRQQIFFSLLPEICLKYT